MDQVQRYEEPAQTFETFHHVFVPESDIDNVAIARFVKGLRPGYNQADNEKSSIQTALLGCLRLMEGQLGGQLTISSRHQIQVELIGYVYCDNETKAHPTHVRVQVSVIQDLVIRFEMMGRLIQAITADIMAKEHDAGHQPTSS